MRILTYLSFQEIDKTKLAMVGGKGANLGELSRIEGIQVPGRLLCYYRSYIKKLLGITQRLIHCWISWPY